MAGHQRRGFSTSKARFQHRGSAFGHSRLHPINRVAAYGRLRLADGHKKSRPNGAALFNLYGCGLFAGHGGSGQGGSQLSSSFESFLLKVVGVAQLGIGDGFVSEIAGDAIVAGAEGGSSQESRGGEQANLLHFAFFWQRVPE
jgi:hypothetical protein